MRWIDRRRKKPDVFVFSSSFSFSLFFLLFFEIRDQCIYTLSHRFRKHCSAQVQQYSLNLNASHNNFYDFFRSLLSKIEMGEKASFYILNNQNEFYPEKKKLKLKHIFNSKNLLHICSIRRKW